MYSKPRYLITLAAVLLCGFVMSLYRFAMLEQKQDDTVKVLAKSTSKNLEQFATQMPEPLQYVPQWQFQGFVTGALSYDETIFETAKLTKLAVKEGQVVDQGQLIAKLYSPTLSERLQQAAASVKSAQAQLTLSKAQLNRHQQLYQQGLIAQSQLEQAQRDFDTNQQNLVEAKAILAQAENEFANTTIKAKTSGLIAKLYQREGDFIQPGEAILRFESTAKQKASFEIPEKLAMNMQIGQQHTLRLHATDERFKATLIEKSLPTPNSIALHTLTFELEATAPQMLGLRVELLYQQDALPSYKISYQAVRYDKDKTPYLIQLNQQSNTLNRAAIEIVNMDSDHLVVTGNLTANTPILVGNDTNLALNLYEF